MEPLAYNPTSIRLIILQTAFYWEQTCRFGLIAACLYRSFWENQGLQSYHIFYFVSTYHCKLFFILQGFWSICCVPFNDSFTYLLWCCKHLFHTQVLPYFLENLPRKCNFPSIYSIYSYNNYCQYFNNLHTDELGSTNPCHRDDYSRICSISMVYWVHIWREKDGSWSGKKKCEQITFSISSIIRQAHEIYNRRVCLEWV